MFTFDGQRINAERGDSIASALLVAGVSQFRSTVDGDARGPFCLMGACYECLVNVDGQNVQSCMTMVREGMQVSRVTSPDIAEKDLPSD